MRIIQGRECESLSLSLKMGRIHQQIGSGGKWPDRFAGGNGENIATHQCDGSDGIGGHGCAGGVILVYGWNGGRNGR